MYRRCARQLAFAALLVVAQPHFPAAPAHKDAPCLVARRVGASADTEPALVPVRVVDDADLVEVVCRKDQGRASAMDRGWRTLDGERLDGREVVPELDERKEENADVGVTGLVCTVARAGDPAVVGKRGEVVERTRLQRVNQRPAPTAKRVTATSKAHLRIHELVAVALDDPAPLVDADIVEEAPRCGVLDLEQPAAVLVDGLLRLVVALVRKLGLVPPVLGPLGVVIVWVLHLLEPAIAPGALVGRHEHGAWRIGKNGVGAR